jgi:hypothetical protein
MYLKLLIESSKLKEQPLSTLHQVMMSNSYEIVGYISPKKKTFMLLPEDDIESKGQTHVKFKLFPPSDKSYNVQFHSHPRQVDSNYLNAPDALATLMNAHPPFNFKYSVILSLKNVGIFQPTAIGKKIPMSKLEQMHNEFLRCGADKTSSDAFFDKYKPIFKNTIKPLYMQPYSKLVTLK